MSFSDSPAGKESAYNAGDPGLIPGSGRSAGEGMGYSLQDSWASFMAQLVKKVKVKSLGHVWLFATPWTVAYQASPTMEFSRQEYWNGLPFPSPGDPPNPGIEPRSSALQTLYPLSHHGSHLQCGRPGFGPWVGRSPAEGKDYPLQYSGLENPMDYIVHGVAKSWTWLSSFHFY